MAGVGAGSAAGNAHVPPDLALDPLARSVEIVALGLAGDGLADGVLQARVIGARSHIRPVW